MELVGTPFRGWVDDIANFQGHVWLTAPRIKPEGSDEACPVAEWDSTKPLADSLSLDHPALKGLQKCCLQAFRFEQGCELTSGEPTLVQGDLYCVAIEKDGEPLYRYEIPITLPQTISRISFELGREAADGLDGDDTAELVGNDAVDLVKKEVQSLKGEVAGRYQLLPSYVASPFYPNVTPLPLTTTTRIRTLEWPRRAEDGSEMAGQTGAPFLTGHGIVFLWRAIPQGASNA